MKKEAFLQGLIARIKEKLNDPAFTHEQAIPVLDRIFSHNTMGTLAGAGLGAGGGALASALTPSEDEEGNTQSKNWITNILAGTGLGAGAGYLTSKVAPSVTKGLVDKLIRQPVGRVLTNSYLPRAYTNNLDAGVLERGAEGLVNEEGVINNTALAKELLRAMKEDKPTSWYDPVAEPRQAIWRKTFNLPIREIDSYGSRFLDFDENRRSAFPNMRTRDGKYHYEKILHGLAQKSPVVRQWVEKGPAISTPQYVAGKDTEILGNFVAKLEGRTGADPWLTISDPWDFNLHRDEALLGEDGKNLARYFLDRIADPYTVQMEAPRSELKAALKL